MTRQPRCLANALYSAVSSKFSGRARPRTCGVRKEVKTCGQLEVVHGRNGDGDAPMIFQWEDQWDHINQPLNIQRYVLKVA
jgi:hypothetical protein